MFSRLMTAIKPQKKTHHQLLIQSPGPFTWGRAVICNSLQTQKKTIQTKRRRPAGHGLGRRRRGWARWPRRPRTVPGQSRAAPGCRQPPLGPRTALAQYICVAHTDTTATEVRVLLLHVSLCVCASVEV